ncbi:MAG: hypothetical protein REI45_13080 [Propionicimonas sp.]|nr:hypothetical protein [Propionicimonas sp.]
MRKGRGITLIVVAIILLAAFVVGEFYVISQTATWVIVAGALGAMVIPILMEHLLLSGVESIRRPNAEALKLEAEAKRNAAEALDAESTSRQAKQSFDAYIMLRAREVALNDRVAEFSRQVIRLEQEQKDIEDEAWRLGQEKGVIPAEVTEALDRLLENSRTPEFVQVGRMLRRSGLAVDPWAAGALELTEKMTDRLINRRRLRIAREANMHEQSAPPETSASGEHISASGEDGTSEDGTQAS